MGKLIASTYGEALFLLAMEEKRLDEFYESAKDMIACLKENRDMENHVPKELFVMMALMAQKGRSAEFLPALEEFLHLVKAEKQIGTVEVRSAASLSEEQKHRLEQKLLKTTRYKGLELSYVVDDVLIGGMTIRVGDRVLDNSIQTKLHRLSKELGGNAVL